MASTTSSGVKRTGLVDWERRVDDVKVSKNDLNYLIMDYLIEEGFDSAAQKFAQEANIPQPDSLEDMQDRGDIKNAIHSGDIRTAIQRINELFPEMLDTNPSLHFSLLRLELIELIRTCTSSPDGDIGPALSFATTHLAPRAPGNPAFLQDLERTMALLCFPPESLAPPLAELMDPALRRKVAEEVNKAVLALQNWMKEAKIRGLVRLRGWAEQRLPGLPPMSLGLGIDANVSSEAMTT